MDLEITFSILFRFCSDDRINHSPIRYLEEIHFKRLNVQIRRAMKFKERERDR